MSWLNALADEIMSKKLELDKLNDVQKQIAELKAEIAKLEAIHDQATGTKPVKSAKSPTGRKTRVWTEEQKREASEKRKATWAAKKAAEAPAPTVKRVKAT